MYADNVNMAYDCTVCALNEWNRCCLFVLQLTVFAITFVMYTHKNAPMCKYGWAAMWEKRHTVCGAQKHFIHRYNKLSHEFYNDDGLNDDDDDDDGMQKNSVDTEIVSRVRNFNLNGCVCVCVYATVPRLNPMSCFNRFESLYMFNSNGNGQ